MKKPPKPSRVKRDKKKSPKLPPVAIERIIREVSEGTQPYGGGGYNRTYSRHNR